MTNAEIITKIEALNEWEALLEEAKALLTQMGMPFKKQEELLNGKEIND